MSALRRKGLRDKSPPPLEEETQHPEYEPQIVRVPRLLDDDDDEEELPSARPAPAPRRSEARPSVEVEDDTGLRDGAQPPEAHPDYVGAQPLEWQLDLPPAEPESPGTQVDEENKEDAYPPSEESQDAAPAAAMPRLPFAVSLDPPVPKRAPESSPSGERIPKRASLAATLERIGMGSIASPDDTAAAVRELQAASAAAVSSVRQVEHDRGVAFKPPVRFGIPDTEVPVVEAPFGTKVPRATGEWFYGDLPQAAQMLVRARSSWVDIHNNDVVMENGYLQSWARKPTRYPVYGEPLVPFHILPKGLQEERARWATRHNIQFRPIDLVPVRNPPPEVGGTNPRSMTKVVVPHDPCAWNDVQSGRTSFRAYVAAHGGAPRIPPKAVVDLTGAAAAAAPAEDQPATQDELFALLE